MLRLESNYIVEFEKLAAFSYYLNLCLSVVQLCQGIIIYDFISYNRFCKSVIYLSMVVRVVTAVS